VTTHLRTALVSILAIALLAWFLRGANLSQVWSLVTTARLDLLAAGLVLVAATYWARVIRWQHLLAPIGPTRWRVVFRATVIGFAALSLLPARAGDVLRPYLVARQERLSAPATFATVIMERVLDLITVLGLLALFVWGFADAAELPPRLMRPVVFSAATATVAALALFALMWLLATHPERVGRLVYASSRVLPHRIADRLAGLATTFSSGFAAARTPANLVMALVWSVPVWLTIAAQTWLVTRAFGIDLPFTGTFLLQALLVIGVAVPTPGGVGSFHEAYRFGVTTFFHAPNDRAVAAAIVVHALSFIPVALVGIIFMAQDGLSLNRLQDLSAEARTQERVPSETRSTNAGGEELPHDDEVPILRTSGR
jgi:uncharacterized protein (TIRG00374 family)